ncbi:TetR family transcriptional regulator, partial [Streptomyces sp. NPDC058171]
TNPLQCATFCRTQIETIVGRGEPVASGVQGAVEHVIDHVVAPIIYRILFDLDPLETDRVEVLVDQALDAAVRV